MRLLLRTTLVGALLLVGRTTVSAQSCQTMAGNLVANCSFENGPPPSGPNYQFVATLPDWSVSGGQFERWSNGFNGFTSKDGVTHLELDSDVGNTSIWQYLNTTVGVRYQVSFWAGHRSLNGQFSQLEVLVGGHNPSNSVFSTPRLTDDNPGQYEWRNYTTNFTATQSSTKIVFRGIGPNNTYGDHIDNISVVSTVPEPSTYALMAAGLLGLFGAARRRKK
ncbi:DUF642 domain-containing protein [Gemmatimonas sp.]|uniref:DUF642 domain-containing protein n=1 Tax=Gemmatimonas sp. TaxID=1962908 RepID=UPI00356B5062